MRCVGLRSWRCVAWLVWSSACTDPAFAPPTADASAASGPSARADADAAATSGDADEVGGRDFDPDAGSLGSADTGTAVDATDAGDALDGDMTAGPAVDAGATAEPLPGWARPLVGRYLKRAVSLLYDEVIGQPVISVDNSLVVISETTPGKLEMKVRVCSFSSQWSDAAARLQVVHPDTFPEATLHVLLGEAPHFSTDKVIQAVGYDPVRQTACSGGVSRVKKSPDQTWILGSTCTCADLPELLPLQASDCRVVDPDGDAQPGILLHGTGLASDLSVALNRSLKVAEGVVRADREHVLREEFAQNSACLGFGCPPLSTPVPCSVLTELIPLRGASDACAEVVALSQSTPVPALPLKDCKASP